ncbi:hypothetical protein SAMN04490240_4096 [Rhodococcus pyridinivorans]|nr:hypothetical protein SAMN04490240_4096 [Rhodococcus pyridinivorans]
MVSCPVCKRLAPVGEESGRVFRHRDGINNVCVMTGRRYPIENVRKEVA